MSGQSRRTFLAVSASAALGAAVPPRTASAAEPSIDPSRPVLEIPRDPALWPDFQRALRDWRDRARRELAYDDAFYRKEEFAWAARNFACCFAMMCDLTFYDLGQGDYTIEAFLDDGLERFGGYDGVVLWHAYPRIGLDDRNQFDFYRDMPGGLPGLRNLCRRLHERNVKAFINYNPWDTGTRREDGNDVEALCRLVGRIEADGIFLDTLRSAGGELRRSLDATRPGVVLESELELPLDQVAGHHLSWAQWFAGFGILRNKWFEPRHMLHQIRRWDQDHGEELQMAWLNGSGMLIWENVFGSWMGWSGSDRAQLRRMLPVQRRYAALLTSPRWEPLVPVEQPGLAGSLWRNDEVRLWTIVNRSEAAVEGPLLRTAADASEVFADLFAGKVLRPRREGEQSVLEGRIEARGAGCFAAGRREALGDDFAGFLESQRRLAARPVETIPPERPIRLVPIARTRPRAAGDLPEGMVAVPGGRFELAVRFRQRECGLYEPGVPSGIHQIKSLVRPVEVRPFAIDLTPVTNADFAEFLEGSGYAPRQEENFLRHWRRGEPPRETRDHPVVYVDLDDARAYARWLGKRLPTEEEWQLAAQGTDGRAYPWGEEMLPGRCNGGESGGTTPVTAFPEGRSPHGCYDMCGNVWEWTESERSDGRTRFAMLRGGSFYRAEGSDWYFDGGPRRCDFTAKVLLMWPGLDRSATVGFRCAVDMR